MIFKDLASKLDSKDEAVTTMTKPWKKPTCTTLMAQELSNHIKAAAWSGEGICSHADFR